MSDHFKYIPSKDRYTLPNGAKAPGRLVLARIGGVQMTNAEIAVIVQEVANTIASNEAMGELRGAELSIAQNRTTYQYDGADKSLLESFLNPMTGPGNGSVKIDVPEFTSLCPMTGQPDFANIKIEYRPKDKCVESKALKLYLGSFRQHGEFHEACVQRISRDLVELLDPKTLRVTGEFTPRGGIPFWPTVSYIRPQFMLEFLKAPQTSLEGLNTFRKGDKWAKRVGDVDGSEPVYFEEQHVGLVYEGKYAGTADITSADYGEYHSLLKKHQQMNYEPDQLVGSLERAYGAAGVGGWYTVLYLGNVKLFSEAK